MIGNPPCLVKPSGFLEAVSKFLSDSGEIKDVAFVDDFVMLMKRCSKIGPRVISLRILRKTTDNDILTRLLNTGGWSILGDWMVDAKNIGDASLLLELLNCFSSLPVTVHLLKDDNRSAKIVRKLRHSHKANDEVKKIAQSVMNSWMKLVRNSDESKVIAQDTVNGVKNGKSKSLHAVKEEPILFDSSGDTIRTVTRVIHESNDQSFTKSLPISTSSIADVKISNNRCAAVKTVPIHFRATGLEQEFQPSERKRKISESEKHASDDVSAKSSRVIFHDLEEVHQRVELPLPNQTQRKECHESTAFISALEKVSPKAPAAVRKKKTRHGSDTQKNDSVLHKDVYNSKLERGNGLLKAPLPAAKSGKKVQWKQPSELTQFFYFELEEGERVNVNRPKNWQEIQKLEKLKERELLRSQMVLPNNSTLPIQTVGWRPVKYIDGVCVPEGGFGIRSTERELQRVRERETLASLFFSKDTLPYSPAEPDVDPNPPIAAAPLIIPIVDEISDGDSESFQNGADEVNHVPGNVGSGSPSSGVSANVMGFLKSISQDTSKIDISNVDLERIRNVLEKQKVTENRTHMSEDNGMHATVPNALPLQPPFFPPLVNGHDPNYGRPDYFPPDVPPREFAPPDYSPQYSNYSSRPMDGREYMDWEPYPMPHAKENFVGSSGHNGEHWHRYPRGVTDPSFPRPGLFLGSRNVPSEPPHNTRRLGPPGRSFPVRPVCSFFSKGSCKYGDGCRFRHIANSVSQR